MILFPFLSFTLNKHTHTHTASGDSGSGYTVPRMSCEDPVENITWVGTVSQVIPAPAAEECCEMGSSMLAMGVSFTASEPSPGTYTCNPGDVGEKDKVFKSGTEITRVTVPPQDHSFCCTLSRNYKAYFSFLPPTGNDTEATCVLYSDVSKEKKAQSGGYSGKSQSQGNCTLFSKITGNKTMSGSTSIQKPKDSKVVLYPSWPASSPYVTAVGSTRFVNQDVNQAEMVRGVSLSMLERENIALSLHTHTPSLSFSLTHTKQINTTGNGSIRKRWRIQCNVRSFECDLAGRCCTALSQESSLRSYVSERNVS